MQALISVKWDREVMVQVAPAVPLLVIGRGVVLFVKSGDVERYPEEPPAAVGGCPWVGGRGLLPGKYFWAGGEPNNKTRKKEGKNYSTHLGQQSR
jgi:hypothetical protein